MPRTTYTEAEVEAITRMAYVTAIRDALISVQGHTMTDDQVAALAPLLTERKRLAATVRDILSAAGALHFHHLTVYERRLYEAERALGAARAAHLPLPLFAVGRAAPAPAQPRATQDEKGPTDAPAD